MPEKFFVTTPIYYVNDVPHLGHLYTTVAADVLARYHRAHGEDVYFLTGTDEHGQKIEEAAAARGVEPRAFVDELHARFKEAWTQAGVRYDDFIRTTEQRHQAVVAELWKRMSDAGDIYLAEYEGAYCVACEDFYTETQAEGGKCPTHGRPLEAMKEESYFFRLSRYTEPLLRHYEAHPTFIRPENRYNEIVSFVRGGLRDLSISRRKLKWGIGVPGDARHVVYVWLDALTNYVSATGGPGDSSGQYARLWPADVHLIGKDILRFHAVYWPAFLLSAGLPLPRQVFVHGWWTVEGQKMSKSLGNVVRPADLFARYGVDGTRYILLREFPFGGDGDYSAAGATTRYNAELANDLGNLLNRTHAMVFRYLDGTAKSPDRTETSAVLVDTVNGSIDDYHRAMAEVAFSRGLDAVLGIVRAGNKFIDTHAPWSLHKAGETDRLSEVLGALCEALRVVGLLLSPFMPDKCQQLAAQLGTDEAGSSLAHLEYKARNEFHLRSRDPLFPRLEAAPSPPPQMDVAPVAAELAHPPNPSSAKPKEDLSAEPSKPEITYDDFAKLDLRVGLIRSAERVKKSDKLLRLMVDIGEERQVVAGIGKRFVPEDLVGKRVLVVTNLKAVKLMGVESRGMILAAGGETGLELAAFPESTPPGTRVK
jgi:methionyl-tRNA synthetase